MKRDAGRMRWKNLLAVIALLCSVALQAQHISAYTQMVPAPLHPEVGDFRARVSAVTSNEGLSQGFVPSIIQDHRGFIWFTTKDGLNRYNGYSFTVFRHDAENPKSIADNYVIYLFEDSRGFIWVATTNTMQVFDPVSETFSLVDLSVDGKNWGISTHMVEDSYGRIWANARYGMLCIDIKPKTDAKSESFSDKYTLHISKAADAFQQYTTQITHPDVFAIDADGGLWMTKNDSVFYSEKKDQTSHELTGKYRLSQFGNSLARKVLAMHTDTIRHTMLFVTDAGLLTIDTRKQIMRYSMSITITGVEGNGVANDEYGINWVSFNGHLYRYNPVMNELKKFTAVNIDSTNWASYSFKAVLIDRGGIMWMGTNGYGVFQYNPRFSCFSLFVGNGITSVKEAHDKQVYVNIHDQFYHLDPINCKLGDKAFNEKILELPEEPRRTVGGFMQDKNDVYWLNYGAGFFSRYDKQKQEVKRFRLTIPGASTWIGNTSRTWMTPDGAFWISAEVAEKMYICRFDPVTETFGTPVLFPDERKSGNYSFISDVLVDAGGDMWFATIQGLYCYSPSTKTWKRYVNIPGDKTSMADNLIFTLCADPDEPARYLWIGTNSGGLNRFDRQTKKFDRFTVKNGLPNNVIYGILADNSGFLWLSTNQGLCRFNPKTHACKNYYASDGLQGNEFNRYLYYKSEDGQLFFGGVNGLSFFYPEKLNGNDHPPVICLTEFRLFNKAVLFSDTGAVIDKPIDFMNEVTLKYDQDVITIGFAAMDFAAPGNNQFKYKLEGFDKDWTISGTRHEAIYTGLIPGEYRFIVMAANSEGTWNTTGRVLRIVVLPPWWQTWWARTIFFVGIVSLITAIILLRTISLRRSRKVLEEKVKERTRELGETIVNLKNTQTQLVKNEKLASFGQLTAGIAHEIKNPLNFINNFSVLSNELIEEYKISADEEEKADLLNSLQNNLEKISFHGNRVDSIIKSMLNHSRTAGARRLPTDINKLCEEFSNLAYHSMRANVPDFSCSMKLNLSKNLPELSVVQQDISRVLLNLLNNAFYAVNEKRKEEGPDFRPEVLITTSLEDKLVNLTIRDNGHGIPPESMDKLFDPFFTTKPAGEGTGLGLSITHDIVHSHGGQITVDSVPGEYTAFTIYLPVPGKDKKVEV